MEMLINQRPFRKYNIPPKMCRKLLKRCWRLIAIYLRKWVLLIFQRRKWHPHTMELRERLRCLPGILVKLIKDQIGGIELSMSLNPNSQKRTPLKWKFMTRTSNNCLTKKIRKKVTNTISKVCKNTLTISRRETLMPTWTSSPKKLESPRMSFTLAPLKTMS